MSDQLLHLVHHVVVNLLILVLFDLLGLAVIDAEQVVAEGGDHEELLHHTVHVADAAQVAQAYILLIALRGNLRNIAESLWLLNCHNEGDKIGIEERLHEVRAALDQLMQQLISSFSALVIWSGCLFLVRAGANLRVDHDLVVAHAIGLSLVEGCKEEFSEDLADQVLLLNDPVAHHFVGLVDNLACKGDQSGHESLLLSSKLLCFDLVFAIVNGLLLHFLLCLDLVDDLVEDLFGIVDGTLVRVCAAHQLISERLQVDQTIEELEELPAWLVANVVEVSRDDLQEERQSVRVIVAQIDREDVERLAKVSSDLLLGAEESSDDDLLNIAHSLALCRLESGELGIAVLLEHKNTHND